MSDAWQKQQHLALWLLGGDLTRKSSVSKWLPVLSFLASICSIPGLDQKEMKGDLSEMQSRDALLMFLFCWLQKKRKAHSLTWKWSCIATETPLITPRSPFPYTAFCFNPAILPPLRNVAIEEIPTIVKVFRVLDALRVLAI